VLSASLNGIWGLVAGLALAGLLLGFLTARYGSPRLPRLGRAVGFGLTGALGLGALAGSALLAWSIGLWQAALTWPPMILGAMLTGVAWFALARAARCWLLATR
jgi:hypothetical protein